MTDMKFSDSASFQLLPIAMRAPTAPSLGEWHGRGLCVGADPDDFFPSHGDPGTQARQICAVRDDCSGTPSTLTSSAYGAASTKTSGET